MNNGGVQVHATSARTYAASCYPAITEEMKEALTGYGMAMMQKQMMAGANYRATEVPLTLVDDPSTTTTADLRPFPSIDPDLADHPRFQTAADLRGAVPAQHHADLRCFKVGILHTVTDKPTNPHFVMLHDKLQGRDAYQAHTCTCGSGVRCGVPCRHYWAVLCCSTAATFHRGLVNDLWFKQAQPLSPSSVRLHTFDNPAAPQAHFTCQRLLYPSPTDCPQTASGTDEESNTQLAKDLTLKRLWGTLLGEAKKAIERAIDTNAHEGLYSALKGFASAPTEMGGGSMHASGHVLSRASASVVLNPDVVRGKGRPQGANRLGVRNRPAAQRQPLQQVDHTTSRERTSHSTPTPVGSSERAGAPVSGGMAASSRPGLLEVPQPGTRPREAAEREPGDGGAGFQTLKRARKCGVCQEMGHNARTCPQGAASTIMRQ